MKATKDKSSQPPTTPTVETNRLGGSKIPENIIDNETYEQIVSGWIVFPLALLVFCPIIFAGSGISNWLNHEGWETAAVISRFGSWLLWGVVAFSITEKFYRQSRIEKNRQAMENQERESRKILSEIKKGVSPGRYFVFLRPFCAENAGCAWYEPSNLMSVDLLYSTTIDDELTQVLNPIGPTLCLGNEIKDVKLGAARVPSTDETWREDIRILLKHCMGIFIFPWHTESITEEVIYIYETPYLLAKTVFFMPPQRSMFLAEEHWREITVALKKKHIELPKYTPCGLLFNARGGAHYIVDHTGSRQEFRSKLLELWVNARA
jgi:hypothetical protein